MRKVTAALFASVDGVVEAPNLWQFDHFDAEMPALMMAALAKQDTVVMGRRTYQEWADYWPGNDEDFGAFINPIPKWVASRTLTGPLAWNNSRLIEGDVVAFVRELKAGEGGEINVAGSPTLVRHLFLSGVIDTLTLMIHPVLAGSGLRRLFNTEEPATRLDLVDHVVTSSGNAVLTYSLRD